MVSVARGARKAKNHIDEGFKTVQAKPWTQPLGQALYVTSEVVKSLGSFLPGEGAIGGALAFGATLLNPELSPEDLKKELQEIKHLMSFIRSQGAKEALVKLQEEIEEKIRNPPREVRGDLDEVWEDVKEIHKQVGESNRVVDNDITRMKIFLVVTDIRFKVRTFRTDSENS